MQIITGFTGTNHITAEMDRDVNIGILGPQSYVLSVGKKIESEVASNNEIKISDGVIVHQGCAGVIKKNTYDSVTIMNGSQGMKRVDLIVLRYERNQDTGVESLGLEVMQGTPAESDPVIPEYIEGDIQAGDLVADMPLYKVELDGINIVAVEPLFQVLMDMSTLNAYLAELQNKYEGIKVTIKKYPMTLEPSSYVGGHLGRIQIPKEDLDKYGTIVGASFGGSSTAPGNAHVLYENSPNDTWVYASCVDATGTLRVSFIKT